MPTPIISVEHLSKAYRIGQKEDIPDTFVAAMTSWMKAPLRNWRRLRRLNTFGEAAVAAEEVGDQTRSAKLISHNESEVGGQNGESNGNGHTTHHSPLTTHQTDTLWALRDVSFDVHEGEVVGIIGRNGAGKSTLLKILSRITEPTHGRAVIRGRVSSLLEVGTGFHPELTGRENIYMNGTILGMRKREIDRKFDEIVDFSGVEKFLDTPIKRYSSGMQVRLAFAVAAHLEPEILIIDEVLAVGDAEFQKKCLGKMQDVAKGGRTVLFVSHNMPTIVNLCRIGILLRDGTVQFRGSAQSAVTRYFANGELTDCRNDLRQLPRSIGVTGRTQLVSVRLLNSKTGQIQYGERISIAVHVEVAEPVARLDLGVAVYTYHGTEILSVFSSDARVTLQPTPGRYEFTITYADTVLAPGRYVFGLGLRSERGVEDSLHETLHFEVIPTDQSAEMLIHHRRGSVIPRITGSAQRIDKAMGTVV